jgi:hypothetical protein
MRFLRILPVILIAGALVLLRGALKGSIAFPLVPASIPARPPLPDQPPHELDESTPDSDALHLLDEALTALSEPRVQWLETAVWQKVSLPGLEYEAEGRYVLAPGHRFRMDLCTRTRRGAPATSEGRLLLVSDGIDLWEAISKSGGRWDSVSRLSLKEIFATLNRPAPFTQVRREFLQGSTFSGVVPLLRNLRERLRWVACERLPGATGLRLTGVWPAKEKANLAPPGEPWPEGLPRLCRLVLDAETLWPRRVEWWGPPGAGGADLLAQMEFRAPVLNHPLSAERCATDFAFDPGSTPVLDRTRDVTADLHSRAQYLASH